MVKREEKIRLTFPIFLSITTSYPLKKWGKSKKYTKGITRGRTNRIRNGSVMRRKIFIMAVLLWMVGIFAFSARNGSISTQDSNHIGMLVGKILIQDFEDWDVQEQLTFVEKIDHSVRKTAHAAEYAVLGMLLVGALYQREEKNRRIAFLSWGIGTVYAATDEIHQLFVPGRSGQLSDVLLDSSGVAIGVVVVLGILYFYRKK